LKEKIFVLVKTYPNLSKKYQETVCVAGITEKGAWRRLYPIPFRKLPLEKRFKKYSWIEVETFKNDKEKLKRRESYRVDPNSIRVVSRIEPGKKGWQERNKILFPLKNKSLEELEKLKKKKKVSLGIICPKKVLEFKRTPLAECRDWEKQLIDGTQKTLAGVYKTPLEKIPWKFSYKFICDDSSCNGHELMCEDWELLQAWRAWRKTYEQEEILWDKIQDRFFRKMIDKNLHFIVGTESRFNKFLIIGLYYPPY